MVKWNEHRRLLEHEPYGKFKLVEVEEPDLMRDIFPYSEVPRIDFDNKLVIPQVSSEIFITDTTFRDGQQARTPYTPQEVLTLFDMMHRLGGPNGVIRQTEFFLYGERDRAAVEFCQEREYRYPEITSWIRATTKDLKLVTRMNIKETGMLCSVSDYHIFLKMKLSRTQAMEQYTAMVKETLAAGIVPRCHFEDITRADVYGFCIPLAIELMKIQPRRPDAGQDPPVRHHGLRRPIHRGGPAAQRPEAGPGLHR